MVVVGMELSNFMIEEILLVFECFGSTDVFQKKVGERGRYDLKNKKYVIQ